VYDGLHAYFYYVKMGRTISSAFADKLGPAFHALSLQHVEAFLANETTVVLPVKTVLELAHTLD
jgi:hypothetical protein